MGYLHNGKEQRIWETSRRFYGEKWGAVWILDGRIQLAHACTHAWVNELQVSPKNFPWKASFMTAKACTFCNTMETQHVSLHTSIKEDMEERKKTNHLINQTSRFGTSLYHQKGKLILDEPCFHRKETISLIDIFFDMAHGLFPSMSRYILLHLFNEFVHKSTWYNGSFKKSSKKITGQNKCKQSQFVNGLFVTLVTI